MPLRFVASAGHHGEVLFAAQLVEGFSNDVVIADRAYSAEHFHDTILPRLRETGSNLHPLGPRPR
ncbi:hypothetical protein GOL95_31915 [Sinorhizobium medicae]|nr:hypothetical protein [Sinorhizobium medicae]MDX1244462.1 hypothetical protein [Sinorhizobium medicae]